MRKIEIQEEIESYPSYLTVTIRAAEEEDAGIVECFNLDKDVSFYCEKEKELSGFESEEEAWQALREDVKEAIKGKLYEVKMIFERSHQVTFDVDEWHVNEISRFYMIGVDVFWEEED